MSARVSQAGRTGWTDAASEAALSVATEALSLQPVEVVLRRVAEVVRDAVPGADEVSVTALRRTHLVGTGFASGSAAWDEREFGSRHGPVVEVARHGAALVIDLRDTSRPAPPYAGFTAAARRHGVRRLVCLPIAVPASAAATEVRGAVTVFALEDRPSLEAPAAAEADALAEDVVRAISGTVIAAVVHAATLAEVGQMQQAMISRAVIDQASGVIMYTAGCTAEEAFERLKTASMRSNRKLRDVAADVVGSASRPPPGKP